jgi:hypothetical protein
MDVIAYPVSLFCERERQRYALIPFRVQNYFATETLVAGIDTIKSRSFDATQLIKSRRMRWSRHMAHMGEGRGAYRVLVWRPEGKGPL